MADDDTVCGGAHCTATKPADIPAMKDLGLANVTIDYQPGNGCRYCVFICLVPQVELEWGGPYLVAMPNRGRGLGTSAVIAGDAFPDWFVAEQLQVNAADAPHVATVIRRALGVDR